MIWESAEKQCQSTLSTQIKNDNRTHSFTRKIQNELGELGFLGSTIQGQGCAGTSYTAQGLINQEVERIDSAQRSALSVQSSLVMQPISAQATEQVRVLLLPELALGRLVGCFGLTEPGAGSDPSGMQTTCIYDKGEGKWVLNGVKTWISNSPIADVGVVWARDLDDRKIKGFVWTRDCNGISTPEIEGKLSLQASKTGMIQLDNTRIAPQFQLQVESMKGPFSCLNNARFGISWGAVGCAQSCFDIARDYTLVRNQFKSPLAKNQLVQQKLADMLTEIQLALAAVQNVSRARDRGVTDPNMISLVKRNNVGKALQIARTARDMLGGNGIVDEQHVMRHLINLETVNTYEGTHDVHSLILGRFITGGLDAFVPNPK